MKKIILVIITLIAITAIEVPSVFALPSDGQNAVGTVTPPSIINRSPTAISDYVPTVIKASFYIGLIAAFIYMVYGGIRWITAAGDAKAVGAARDTIVQAVVGIILLSVAFAVSQILYALVYPPGKTPAPLNPYDGVGQYCDGVTYLCKQSIHACVNNVCECADPLNCTKGPY